MNYKTRRDFEILSREDFQLDGDSYIIFEGYNGSVHDATGTIVDDVGEWIMLKDSAYPCLPKKLILHIAEV